MIEISYSDSKAGSVEEAPLRDALMTFLSTLFEGDRTLSLYLTDDDEMRGLNREYRDKDATTDVLSWSYFEEDPESLHVGDLAVSLDQVQRQAEQYGWDLQTELLRMLAHGCVHLAGWDHERSEEEAQAMLAQEEALLNAIGLPDLYRA